MRKVVDLEENVHKAVIKLEHDIESFIARDTGPEDKLTPLMRGCIQGDFDFVKSLCEPKPSTTGYASVNTTFEAFKFSDHHNTLESILNERGGWNNSTPLMFAVQSNSLNIVKYLISKGADVSLKNDLGNTAGMIAAEEGFLDCVKYCIESGANIGDKNDYGQTALILGVENSHIDVVQWLASYVDAPGAANKQLEIRNKYDKNALLVACEFGKDEIVAWVVEASGVDVNAVTFRGYSALMYACAGGTEAHERVVDLLLSKNVDVNHKAKLDHDTALIWAVVGGRASIVQKLLSRGATCDNVNKKGFTAITKAANMGLAEAVQCLVEFKKRNSSFEVELEREVETAIHKAIEGAKEVSPGEVTGHLDVFNFLVKNNIYSARDFKQKCEQLQFLWMRGHVESATEYLRHIEKGSRKRLLISDVINLELDDLATRYSSTIYTKSLEKLVYLAGKHNPFQFELLIQLIPRFLHPTDTLRHMLPIFLDSLYKSNPNGDIFVLDKLVKVAASIMLAATNHPMEKLELEAQYTKIEQMIDACGQTGCMHETDTIQAILCCDINEIETKRVYRYTDPIVEKAQAFSAGPLAISVENGLTTLLHCVNISTYVDDLYWGYLRKPTRQDVFCRIHRKPGFGIEFSAESKKLRRFQSNLVFSRYCPAAMLFFEGFGRLTLLLLISFISLDLYNQPEFAFGMPTRDQPWRISEYSLLVFEIALILGEHGEMCGDEHELLIPRPQEVIKYFSTIWNCIDFLMSGFLVAWAVLRVVSYEPTAFRGCLASSLMFLSFRLLQYVSFIESLGKLTIMTYTMLGCLVPFGVIYAFCIYGFCVVVYSLWPFETIYMNPHNVFFSAFGLLYGNFNVQSGKDPLYFLGVIIMVAYIVFTSILLMSLVVARMSATHNEIEEKSFERWQFTKAQTVEQYLLLEEKRPDCMLPPPFNIFPIVVWPLHTLYLNHKRKVFGAQQEKIAGTESAASHTFVALSISGTVSDIFMGILMSFLAPIFELFSYFRALSSRAHIDEAIVLEVCVVILFFPFIYAVYVLFLGSDSFTIQTFLHVERTGLLKLHYDRAKVYQKPRKPKENSEILSIKILRAELAHCTNKSIPIVKLRIGDVEAATANPTYIGKLPVWAKEQGTVLFPLDDIDLSKEGLFTVEVLDKNVFAGTSRIVGTVARSPQPIQNWVANKRFEGKLDLDDGAGALFVVIKVISQGNGKTSVLYSAPHPKQPSPSRPRTARSVRVGSLPMPSVIVPVDDETFNNSDIGNGGPSGADLDPGFFEEEEYSEYSVHGRLFTDEERKIIFSLYKQGLFSSDVGAGGSEFLHEHSH